MLPDDVREIEVASSIDGTLQKSLVFFPDASRKSPLIVGLHTWSYDRFNQLEAMLPFCRDRGWGLLLPEFRGPNLKTNPHAREACGSVVATGDILDAAAAVKAAHPVDEGNIFLLGGSGGGHMALLTAARSASVWRGVSAWVPITDLEAWHRENPDYAAHIAACCGGAPGPDTAAEYRERSPLSYVKDLKEITLSIHHGRHDQVVSWRHSWRLAQALDDADADFYLDIFDGGHEIRYDRAFDWFDRLYGSGKDEVRLTG